MSIFSKIFGAPSPEFGSPIEKLMYEALRRSGIEVRLQHPVGPYRADLAIPYVKLAIECDGKAYHTGSEQIIRDRLRDRYFVEAGWRVVRFTGSEIYQDADACARQVGRIVGSIEPTAIDKVIDFVLKRVGA